jgi:hypothetical protein
MKRAVEMGSDVMIYKPNFIMIGSSIQNLIRGIHRHTDSMVISRVYFYFFKIRKVG